MTRVLTVRPRTAGVGELALTATLLSVYVSCRGAARGLGAVQALVAR